MSARHSNNSGTEGQFQIAVGTKPFPEDGQAQAAFVRWAQRGHILGQVAAVVDAPAGSKLADILENARLRSGYDKRMLVYEANRITRALAASEIEPILLKGSAYVAEHLLAGIGRRVSDIDILVDEEDISGTETLLQEAGWTPEETTANPYDQRYYRQWMHELPPMRHTTRRTLIDVHHRLLPRTARIKPDHRAMMAESALSSEAGLRVFSPTDRFIHSAIHIFGDGAFETPARSFIELYYLYADLSEPEKGALADRAVQVHAGKPVAGALWAIKRNFGVPTVVTAAEGRRLPAVSRLLKWAVAAVTEREQAPLANLFLYVRSHYMRMPLPLLVGHLWKKVLRRV